jgi:hypothetical protein
MGESPRFSEPLITTYVFNPSAFESRLSRTFCLSRSRFAEPKPIPTFVGGLPRIWGIVGLRRVMRSIPAYEEEKEQMFSHSTSDSKACRVESR